MKVINYNRVSSKDQNLDRQCEAFENFAKENQIIDYVVFSDKQSGKDFERKGYQEMLDTLERGDLVVIKSIDRLGRDYDLIIEEWTRITKTIGADIVVLDMPLLDTREKKNNLTGKFISDIVLQLLSYVAETERQNTRQRQKEGIAIAKAKGVKFGRENKIQDDNTINEFTFDYNNGMPYSQMQEKYDLSKPSVISTAKRLGLQPRNNRKVSE